MRIHLLHMNDVHSQLESYMRLGHQLRQLRRQLETNGDIVLTFDVGDVLDRVRPETEASMGLINVDMMAQLGVDGWVFGNNEGLTIPVADWPVLTRHANAIVFGTNFKRSHGVSFDFFSDYHIFERQGIRIGVFGVSPNYQLPYEMLRVHTEDPVKRGEEAVTALLHQNCDVIVCLSHLGRHADHDFARRVPDINVVLGGHSHEFMTAEDWVGATAVFQPGKHARAFGYTTLTLDAERRVISVESRAIPVHYQSPFDEKMEAAYVRHLPHVERVLEREVVALSERLPLAYDAESPFANLLADVLFDEFEGDFAVMMTGALNASARPGVMDLENLLGACPTPTRPVIVSLLGSELYAVFEQSVQPSTYARHGIGFGFRGGQIGYLVVSGASVILSRDAAGILHVNDIYIGNHLMRPDRMYRVITCEFLWLSSVFPQFRNARAIEYREPLIREVLLARFQDEGRLEKAKQLRYSEQ